MSVAKAYAQAFFEAAKERGTSAEGMNQLEDQLDTFIESVEGSPEARLALYGPVTTAEEKSAIIRAIGEKISAQPLLIQLLTLMASKGRLGLLPAVREVLYQVRVESEGGVLGKLVSAEPMKEQDLDGLSAAFTKKLGKKVWFQASTDASLLAGMKVTVNGTTYDGSLRSQLQRLRDRFVLGI